MIHRIISGGCASANPSLIGPNRRVVSPLLPATPVSTVPATLASAMLPMNHFIVEVEFLSVQHRGQEQL